MRMKTIPLSPFSDITNDEWAIIVTHAQVLQQRYQVPVSSICDSDVLEALMELWQLSDEERYKIPLTHPSLQLPELLQFIIAYEVSPNIIRGALGCLWYLSRCKENDIIFGRPSLRLVPILMTHLRHHGEDIAYKILRNCVFHPDNHVYMLSDEIGYVEYWKQVLITTPLSVDPFHVYSAIGSTIRNENIYLLTKWRIHELIYQRLVAAGTNPLVWLGRDCGIEDHGLTFLTCFSTVPNGRFALLKLNPFHFFYEVSGKKTIEGIRCLMILFNLYGKDLSATKDVTTQIHWQPSGRLEANNLAYIHHKLSLRVTKEIYRYYINILFVTIHEDEGIEARQLHAQGYDYGMFMMRDITLFLSHLVLVYPAIRYHMFHDFNLLSLLSVALDHFITNTEEFAARNDVAKICAGGGGQDQETVENILELFIQLSHVYWELKQHQHQQATNYPPPSLRVFNEVFSSIPVVTSFENHHLLEKLFAMKKLKEERSFTLRLSLLIDLLIDQIHQMKEDETMSEGGPTTARNTISSFKFSYQVQRLFSYSKSYNDTQP